MGREGLRNNFGRCKALLEVGALPAHELGHTREALRTIRCVTFPIVRDYDTWCDQKGHIAFTNNRGLTGVGLERKDLEWWQERLRDGIRLPKDFDGHGLVPPREVRDSEKI